MFFFVGCLGWAFGWADVGKSVRPKQTRDAEQNPFGLHRTAQFADFFKKRPVQPFFRGSNAQAIF
jgi:hypothetical protein